MTARAFLVRGLLAGLLAGFVAFGVAYTVGEPHVQAAIDIEEAHSAEHADHGSNAGHTHEENGTVVSRHNQRTWGLLTGSLGVGTALGGIVGLIAAGIVGRLGRWTPGQSTAFVALAGFVAVGLVPFLKYPSNPPAVGNADTIGSRTTEYFIYLLISIAAAVAATALGQRLWQRRGTFVAVLAGVALYLGVVVVAGLLMPTVDEVAGFPADILWSFRVSSILTQASLWAAIGVILVGLVGKLYRETTAAAQRRELAASL